MINYNHILDKRIFNYFLRIPIASFWVWKQKVLRGYKKNLEDVFNFSNVDEKLDEFICLRSKGYSFKCGDDNKNKLKGVSKSQTKHNNFEEF